MVDAVSSGFVKVICFSACRLGDQEEGFWRSSWEPPAQYCRLRSLVMTFPTFVSQSCLQLRKLLPPSNVALPAEDTQSGFCFPDQTLTEMGNIVYGALNSEFKDLIRYTHSISAHIALNHSFSSNFWFSILWMHHNLFNQSSVERHSVSHFI